MRRFRVFSSSLIKCFPELRSHPAHVLGFHNYCYPCMLSSRSKSCILLLSEVRVLQLAEDQQAWKFLVLHFMRIHASVLTLLNKIPLWKRFVYKHKNAQVLRMCKHRHYSIPTQKMSRNTRSQVVVKPCTSYVNDIHTFARKVHFYLWITEG